MQFSPNTRCTAEELVRNEHWDGQVISFVFCVSRQGFGVREVSDRGTLGNNIKQIPLCGFFQQLVIRHEFACEPLLSQRQLFYLGSSLTNDLREQFTTVIRKKKKQERCHSSPALSCSLSDSQHCLCRFFDFQSFSRSLCNFLLLGFI